MTDAERITRLRETLIDAKDRLFMMGLTRHDPLVQRIYATLDPVGPPRFDDMPDDPEAFRNERAERNTWR
jgi:hypothetical protein